MVRLAVIILTKNEENNIEDCIQSASFADEIVIIDSGSTDATQAKAEALGARFVVHPMDEDGFAGQRNFALTQTEAEWVFFLDADERIVSEAAGKIREIVQSDAKAAYFVERKNIVFGQMMMHGAHRPDYVCRLFPRAEVKWQGKVHEGVQTSLQEKKLTDVLRHCTYITWEQYFTKFNSYTSLAAREMLEKGKSVSSMAVMMHAFGGFFKTYVLKQGFLDGFLGFVMSFMSMMYVTVKYMKLKNMQRIKANDSMRGGTT